MIVVSDTTPFNYLVQLDMVHLLGELYRVVYTPSAVIRELRHPGTPSKVRQWARTPPGWLVVKEPPQSFPAALQNLGAGEHDALLLAVELRADRILADDRQARAVAIRMGFSVSGTLAVIRSAAIAGKADFEEATQRLLRLGFRASADAIEEARP